LFVLPQTATYRVLYHPGRWKAGIEFRLFESDDPTIGPGIKPEQVSIDFGFLGEESLKVFPYEMVCGEGDQPWPSHLGVEKRTLEFRIMPVDAYRRMDIFNPGMAELEAALRPGGKLAVGPALPHAQRSWWGAYIMSARPQLLSGDGWRGVRWIAGFGGDEDYPSSALGYVFAGITNDGRYLIVFSSDISHPAQKRLLPARKINGTPPNTWESSDPEKETPMRLQLEKSLADADPASFQPNLDQLDAVIRSLKLKQ
jgi:hypothetical protein